MNLHDNKAKRRSIHIIIDAVDYIEFSGIYSIQWRSLNSVTFVQFSRMCSLIEFQIANHSYVKHDFESLELNLSEMKIFTNLILIKFNEMSVSLNRVVY